MTKQQLREAIRRVIKQELNEGMKDKDVPNPNKGKWRIVGLETGNIYPNQGAFYNTEKEAKAASGKLNLTKDSGVKYVQLKDTMKVYTKELKEALTDEEKKELDNIEDIIRHKTKTDSASISKKMADRYKELLAKKKIAEGPAVADPETEEDVEVTPYVTPDEDDLGIGDKDKMPKKIPAKAEKNTLKKIIDRYTMSLNEKKSK